MKLPEVAKQFSRWIGITAVAGSIWLLMYEAGEMSGPSATELLAALIIVIVGIFVMPIGAVLWWIGIRARENNTFLRKAEFLAQWFFLLLLPVVMVWGFAENLQRSGAEADALELLRGQ